MTEKINSFSNHARYVLHLTEKAAASLNTCKIQPEHVLVGMTRALKTDARNILDDYDIIDAKLWPFVKGMEIEGPAYTGEGFVLSEEIKRMLHRAADVARMHDDTQIRTPHLLIGLMQCDTSRVDAILDHFAVEREELIEQIEYYLNDPDSIESRWKLPEERRTSVVEKRDEDGCISMILRLFGY